MSEPRDYAREAAHRRYEKAAELAESAGSGTQAGLLDAYKNLFNNADWTPEEGWADNFHEGVAAYNPNYLRKITQSDWSSNYQPLQPISVNDVSLVEEKKEKEPSFVERFQDAQQDLTERDNGLNGYDNPVKYQSPRAFVHMDGSADQYANQQPMTNEEAMQAFQAEQANEQSFIDQWAPHYDWIFGGYGDNLSPNDPMYQQKMDEIFSEGYQASPRAIGATNEMRRRFTDENSELKNNPLDWNIFGLSSQEFTKPGARALYDNYYADHPEDGQYVDRGVVDKALIDDGHSPEARESLYMTGEQYLNYRNAGIPGRDIYHIDPNEIYSKQDEMEVYGFVPYITDDESWYKFHDLASANEINNLAQHLTNARRENTDFGIMHDGKEYSGKHLLQEAEAYVRKANAQMEDESRIVSDRSQTNEYSIPIVPVYTVTATNGETQDFVGLPTIAEYRQDENNTPFIYIEWPDGTYATFDDEDDLDASMKKGSRIAEDGEDDLAEQWVNVDPFDAGNGELLRADKAFNLFEDMNNPEAHKYDAIGWNNPNVQHPTEGFLPWVADIALGSAPLFWWPTATAQAYGNTMSSATGMQPGSDNYLDGTYSMIADKPTKEQQLAAAAGSAALPLTERLWGNIGGSLLGKTALGKKIGKVVDTKHPIVQHSVGAFGEGAEEIPGNIVEDIMQGHGPSEFYADDLLDENGNPVKDSQGRIVRDPNTSLQQRFRNFAADIPESFLGGAILGGTLGAARIPEYNTRYKLNKLLNGDTIDADYASDIVVPLSEEEINAYNR